jgi:sugar/nucleoside kinase (ribokinase family)
MYKGLFVGLVTLDLIYLADSPPQNNQKIVAMDYTVAAGGPGTNAAVTFSYLGNTATVAGVVGTHPMTQLIKSDLAHRRVEIVDLHPSNHHPPPVSSIIVTQGTGERAVISLNAVKMQASSDLLPENILDDVDIVLIDGHQMAISRKIAIAAKTKNIPVVIDGGSWKPGWENILPYVDYAICSSNFLPPNCHRETEVLLYLQNLNIPYIAITHGEQPITYSLKGKIGEIDVPPIQAVDTLGAGDIFHGAFCHSILQSGSSFTTGLAAAVKIASLSCGSFGTRSWMNS